MTLLLMMIGLNQTCRNPCYNGSSAMTATNQAYHTTLRLRRNPCYNGSSAMTLIIMDKQALIDLSRNPCYNGSSAMTKEPAQFTGRLSRNPCYNGSSAMTELINKCLTNVNAVAILVIMEVAL